MYPKGNGRTDALALYLAVAEEDQQAFGLQRNAAFKLTLLAQGGEDVTKDTQHMFTSRETDWGERAGGLQGNLRQRWGAGLRRAGLLQRQCGRAGVLPPAPGRGPCPASRACSAPRTPSP